MRASPIRTARAAPVGRAARSALALLAALAALGAGCKRPPAAELGRKVAHVPMRADVGSLDPVAQSSQYDNTARTQIYESLLQYKYLVRPYELEPLLAARMPEVSADQLTFTFELKRGVRFHDDPCFVRSGGRGRELEARDVVYSLERMADRDQTPAGWWLLGGHIVGFDEFQRRMNARPTGAPFDWDAPIEGLVALDRYRVRITLVRPFPQLLYVLAMDYTGVVPRECAERYGKEFGSHGVGTGPFLLRSFERGHRVVYARNPSYRAERYPAEASAEARRLGLLGAAGRRLPLLDGLVLDVFEQDQPMWLKFRVRDLDLAQVPAEYHSAVFTPDRRLRAPFAREGLRNHNLPLLDFIYKGFNMEDPVVGVGPRAKLLRQAISLALDTRELDDAFYNDTLVLYDGPIPPGIAGYVPGVTSPYRGPRLDQARALLARAGYPGGAGLPPLEYHTDQSGNSIEQTEMVARQLRRVGIRVQGVHSSFPDLMEKLSRKKAQMFSLAWGADYPDAENLLQLFYGPNASPGSNNFNFSEPEYDRLYERARTLLPSPEREELYARMRAMIIEACPAIASMARTRFYLWNRRLRNVYPDETFTNWLKYLDVEGPR